MNLLRAKVKNIYVYIDKENIQNILRHDALLCPQRKHSSGVPVNGPTRYKAYSPLVPPEMQSHGLPLLSCFYPLGHLCFDEELKIKSMS